jgi:hypothetical protein
MWGSVAIGVSFLDHNVGLVAIAVTLLDHNVGFSSNRSSFVGS